MDLTTFKKLIPLEIEYLGGGYYHPNMLLDGRVNDSRYAASGETMYDIDRLNGGSVNTSTAGQQFWSIIDNVNAANTWQWNYKGGDLAPQLEELAAEMMYPEFDLLCRSYLSPQSQNIVNDPIDHRIAFNFIYATYNGAGWFKGFANIMNDAVAKGITNRNDLVNILLNSRTGSSNSLISQGGREIAQVFDYLKKNEIS